MLGFITAAAIVYFGVRWYRRNHFYGGRRMRRRRREWMLDRLSAHLGTKPSQDRVLEDALDEVMDAMGEEKATFRTSRGRLAQLLNGEEFDQGALDDILASQKEALGRVQASIAASMKKAHEALDGDQRARLGRLIEHGPHGRCGRAVTA